MAATILANGTTTDPPGQTGRRLARIAVIGALALLLTGLAAPAVGAAPRNPARQRAVAQANDYIFSCFQAGGTPLVVSSTETSIVVSCFYPDGTIVHCDFFPATVCSVTPPRQLAPGTTVVNGSLDGAVLVEAEAAPSDQNPRIRTIRTASRTTPIATPDDDES